MPKFLGADMQYPVRYETHDDEIDASGDSPQQVFAGGLTVRYGMSFLVEASSIVSGDDYGAKVAAHIDRYGHGREWAFSWVQPTWAIDVPTGPVSVVNAATIGADLVLLSTDLEIGTYFTLTGFRTLYKVVEAGNGRARYINPRLTSAATPSLALDLSPTVNVQHDRVSGKTFSTNAQGFSVPVVTVRESR